MIKIVTVLIILKSNFKDVYLIDKFKDYKNLPKFIGKHNHRKIKFYLILIEVFQK